MADPIIRLKRSAVAGKRPTLANLPLGEVALNTYDGRLFVRQDTGGVGIATTIRAVNPWSENYQSGGEHSIYYDGGDVGIGTQNPTSSLDVNGTVTATSFVGNGSSITGITFGQLSDVTLTNVGQHDIAVYHDGEGWLNDPGASRVVQEVRNVTGIAITQAYPVYETGYNQGNERVTVDLADAGISTAMPALGIIHDADLGNNSNGYVIISGIADGIDTSGYTEGDELYVAVGGGLTNTRPTGATSLIQKIGTVLRSHATTGSILVQGAGRTNDVPNTISVSSSITAGDGFYGDGSGITGLQHSQVIGVITGLVVKEEGSVVGTAGSVAHLNFVSPNLTVTASGVGATLTLTDDPTFNSLDVTGIATANSFSGSGINLSGIVTSITAGDNISISTATGNVTITGLGNTANISADTLVVTGVSTLSVVTGATYYGDGSNITGLTYTQVSGAMGDLVDDTTPQLGGNLDVNNKDITGTGNVNITGVITATTFSGSGASLTNIPNSSLDNSSVSYGGVQLSLGGSDATPAFDLSDATNYPTSSLSGTITNAQLAGSIANSKLSNSTVSYGGIQLSLGGSDATPAFDLSDATNYPYSSLTGITTSIVGDTSPQLGGNLDVNGNNITGTGNVNLTGIITATTFSGNLPTTDLTGTITNSQLAGSIANSKLANSTVSYGGVQLSLGGSDATPAFDLSDATNYPYNSLIGITTSIVGDTSPQLGGNLDLNSNNITGTGDINITGNGTFSGNVSIAGTLTYEDVTNVDSVGLITARSGVNVTGNITVTGTVDGRDVATDGSKLDGIESGATGDQTASEILTAIKTVDGSGSGLDADTLDGIQGASFIRSDVADTATGVLTLQPAADRTLILNRNVASPSYYNNGLQIEIRATSGTAGIALHRSGYSHVGIYHDSLNQLKFNMSNGTPVLNHNAGTIWGSGNDGSGSGLDADTVDGIHASSFIRSDANDSTTGLYSFAAGAYSANVTYGGRSIQTNLDVQSTSMRGGVLVRNMNDFRSITDTASFMHYDAYNTSATSYAFRAAKGTTLSDTFWVKGDGNAYFAGNIGIGTNNASYPLDLEFEGDSGLYVKGTNNHASVYIDSASGSASYLRFHNNGAAKYWLMENSSGLEFRPNGGSTVTRFNSDGNISVFNNNYITFGPNSTWSRYLRVGGNGYQGSTTIANIATTNGNLHIDAADGSFGTYLNYYAGSFIAFGSGSDSIVAYMDNAGQLYKGSNNTGSKYWNAANDGSGSGLDADTVDGLHSDQVKIRDARADGDITPTNFTNGVASFTFTDDIASSTRTWDSVLTMKGWQSSTYRVWQLMGNASTSGDTDTNLYFRQGIGSSWGSLEKVWTSGNDGAGSGLDADLLDGVNSGSFLRSDAADTATGLLTLSGGLIVDGSIHSGGANYAGYRSDSTNIVLKGSSTGVSGIFFQSEKNGTNINHGSDYGYIQYHAHGIDGTSGESGKLVIGVANDAADTVVLQSPYKDGVKISFKDTASGTGGTEYTVWHAGNDGAGSGLDADTLDGIQASSFLRSDATDSRTGAVTFTDFRARARNVDNIANRVDSGFIEHNTAATADGWPENSNTWYHLLSSTHSNTGNYYAMQFAASFYNSSSIYYRSTNGNGSTGWNKMWHAGNDGSGSGLDADLLDGQQGSSFLRSDADTTKTTGQLLFNDSIPIRFGTGADAQLFHNGSDMYFDFQVAGDNWYFRDSSDTAIFAFTESTGNFSLYKGSVLVGDGGDQSTVQIKKADNNVSDHIQFYNGTTRMGEIGCEDTTWLRINQETAKNIYTPRVIRADGGFLVVGNTVWNAGNDGSGSGLDADTLDGVQGSNYLRSDIDDSTSGYLVANGFVGSGGALRISNPGGASFATTTATTTGYLKITLPVSWTNTMMRMTIKCYEYSTGESFEIHCGGYNYTTSNWINTFAYILGGNTTNRNFTVRFGHDGSKCAIYIGESNSTWSYFQFGVFDFLGGYQGYTADNWHTGWSCSITTTLGNISGTTFTTTQLNKYVDGNTVWHAGNDGSGSGLDADLLDGLHRDSASTANTVVSRDGSADINCRLLRPNYGNNSYINGALAFRTNNSNDNYVRFCNDTALIRTYLGVTATASDTNYLRSNAFDVFEGTTSGRFLRFQCFSGRTANSSSGNLFPLEVFQATPNTDAAITFHINNDYAAYFGLDGTTNDLFYGGWSAGAAKYKIWHAANDGSGSGLDADTIDGTQLSNLMTLSGTQTITGDKDFDGTLTYDVMNGPNTSDRYKIRVYSSGDYAIGMQSGITFGGLSDWGMTFLFNNEDDRGFWWGDGAHTTAQGAMALTTNGKLTVAHSMRIGYGESDTTIPGATHRLDVSGSILATGDVTAFSDITLKEDIEVIPNALDKVSQIRGVTFTRKDLDDESRKSGVIAQEVEKVLPEVVTTNEDGIKTVAYGNLVGLLIESIKELKAEVETLKKGA